jgi:phenylalanyl-tRNA synthetase alpha chain
MLRNSHILEISFGWIAYWTTHVLHSYTINLAIACGLLQQFPRISLTMADDLPDQVLRALEHAEKPLLSSEEFPELSFNTIKSALDRLGSRDLIEYQQIDREEAILTPEAEGIVKNGSHEARVFEAVRSAKGGLKIKDLPKEVGAEAAKIGQGTAFKLKWIKKDGDTLNANTDLIQDVVREQLHTIHSTKTYNDPRVLSDLRKRKLIEMKKAISFKFSKGPKYTTKFVKEETDLTADMLASGAWKDVKLKPYNFKAKGALTPAGALHPLNKVRHEFRQIFFEMGFTEMPTNRFVETGFWNFDALFIPQQHPARDVQDTFFISDPLRADPPREDPSSDHTTSTLPTSPPPEVPSSDRITSVAPSAPTHKRTKSKAGSREDSLADRTNSNRPTSSTHQRTKSKVETKESRMANSTPKTLDYKQYWDNVCQVHQEGDKEIGSIGYRYPWSEDESLKLVLRTHTTAVSTYMLHKLSLDPRPARYFSIDRVFRNETVDQTHLAEFHQIEGVIADYGLALGGLIGFMEVFFKKMGIDNLRFKPAYNPYTEPSLEIFGFHPGLNKWVEIGNSGMFRPEMLEPMGLPKDMRVYGWGLSLERPTMIK